MSMTAYRGVVRGGVVRLNEQTPLTEGTEVLVTPLTSTRGSPSAILAALANAPQVPAEWVDELEQAIMAGRRPLSPPVTFEPGSREGS